MTKINLMTIDPALWQRWAAFRTNAMRHLEITLDRYVANMSPLENWADFGRNDKSIVRMVGGCVRDLIRGETPKDVDYCTPLTPEQVITAFKAHGGQYRVEIIPTGLQHGTITIRYPNTDEQFEITTLRMDTDTDGRHAEVEFVHDYQMDAERRDFTMNAMSIDSRGDLYDYYGGLDDARMGVVKFVGDSEKRIVEDYLRILRFFRFSARFGKLTLDVDTSRALRRNMVHLAQISGERIWAELAKILVMPNADVVLQFMASEDFFQAALNVRSGTRSLNRDADAFAHFRQNPTIPVIAYLYRWLMNSAAEMSVFPLDIADRLNNRLKFSREEAGAFRVLCRNMIGEYPRLMYSVMIGQITLEHARLVMFMTDHGQFPQDWVPPEFPVRGQDLLDLGWPSGKAMGTALKVMRERWAHLYASERVELNKANLIKWYAEGGQS